MMMVVVGCRFPEPSPLTFSLRFEGAEKLFGLE